MADSSKTDYQAFKMPGVNDIRNPMNARFPRIRNFLQNINASPGSIFSIGVIGLGINGIIKGIKEINRDFKRKQLITELSQTDPVLSQVDKDQLLEWYATIYHFAPKFSLDKSSVRETLQNFARFGRVDVNTLKMLADTEKATQQAAAADSSWGSIISGLASAASLGG